MSQTLKRGQEVIVIAGSHKKKRGKILEIRDNDRVVVEKVAVFKRHMRRSQEHPEGAIVEREGSIHRSNVMDAARYDAKRKEK